ncbi:hypothetical protein F4781DRAFT_279160 [Annulohypoxylon bovei var. microspora]|nr:hypothetical protein F4781DRAFT_279160 [Annulohypoxylon bovei var. microspora]
MATPGATQALLGAFFFGILFNAASAALVLYVIGHGSTIFRDGLRLVLILFLLSSAAWALVEFLATIIEPTATSTCQVAAIFSSVFDQLGKIFIEQYLVWATRGEGKKAVLSFVPQILLFGRFGVGMAFIGLTGNEFSPTCVPISKVFPIAITVIVLDAVIFGLLAIQLFSMGSTKDSATGPRAPKRSVGMIVLGLGIWIGMSVVLLLGMKSTELVLKTTLPALGLAILVALVTVLSGTLVLPRGPPPPRPDSPTTRDLGRDLSSSDSAEYAPSRYEDVKGVTTTTTMAMAAYAAPNDGSMPAVSFPIAQMPGAGQAKYKKNIKGNAWSKGTTGKLAISKPVIVEQEGMNNPLDRIPTVDLATAANHERERRIKLAQRGSTLIAQRPAPQPPNAGGQDGILSREISTKRKQISPATLAQLERAASNKSTKTTTGLSVEANASSTSSELSPGTDKVRRRSPRQPPPPPIPSTFQPVRPGEPIRIPIPRPRTPPESPKDEPVKTPLQRRPTTGLPSNPRAQAMKAMKEAEAQRQETVMFVNNIVYDDPNAVDNIVQGASKAPMTSLNSRDSVVNRPRPIPRKGDKDRQVFPAELSPSQNHRRSKSGGSIASRKSILQSMPGSPTQLPPLPPPPKSAGIVSRPLPNDTKSMTFDEKMNFLYAPVSAPSSATISDQRRSAVPQIPPLPATYMVDAQQPKAESIREPDTNSERRISKTTDRSSIRTTSILGIEDIPLRLVQKADSSRNAIEELGQSWLPGISVENERQKPSSGEKINRKSSPVIPEASHFSVSSMKSESRVRDDDRSTIWGSVHSPVAAVAVKQSRLNARSTYIQNSRIPEEPVERNSYANIPGEVMEVMEVMLDMSSSPVDQQESPDNAVQEIPIFHHRIGEECPTFSTRKDKLRSRKMPPPPPLVLNRKNSKRAIIVQPAEPSPLEAPEVAYQMIQAQLQRFEQPNRDSAGSQGGRLALLENLELEMGQLENRWQNRVDRESMSSINTTTSKGSRPPSIAERRASRRASLRNGPLRSKSQETTGTPSSQSSGTSSENSQASAWQARLAEAQMEYMKSTPDLLTKRNNLNFLSVSKAALGSPSPPDSDESDYENGAPGSVQQLKPTVFKPVAQVHVLWKPQSPVQYLASSGLWVGAAKKSQSLSELHELPGLSVRVRPAIRKSLDSLMIESSRLWEKPAESSSPGAMKGLWKKYDPSESSTATRPLTMRPPRKNKRVTLLPDILENPEPLPDKRGFLGLFQFPWGEKSENASIQPRPARMFMAMPGTMTTGGPKISAALEARSKQLEAEELTTSFFEDYEAEEEGDNVTFSDSDNEGDEFDENTLWEIANLLKSENVPSKNSLLPLPLRSQSDANSPVSSNDVVEQPTEEYRDDGLVLEEPIPVDRLSLNSSKSTSVQPLLWARPETLEVNSVGLPQPDSSIWKSYIPEPARIARNKSHAKEITPIQSNELWEPRSNNGDLTSTGLLWSVSKPNHKDSVVPVKMNKTAAPSKSLWVQLAVTPISDIKGLFNASHLRADYRRTSKMPAALLMERKPRAVEMPLAKLTSWTLWSRKSATKSQLMWEKPTTIYSTERDGLFDSNESRADFRRTAKEPAAISIKKVTRTIEKPLAGLLTNNLWSREIVVSSQPAKGAQLFVSQKSVMAAQSIETATMVEVQAIPMWEKPETSLEPEHDGLFDASVARNNYRRTSKAPAAILISKKPRANKEPLPALMTTNLWAGESSKSNSIVSSPESLDAREVPASTVTKLMWEKSTLLVSRSDFEGLFDANIVRVDYRRTSKLPAAVSMTRTPRKMGGSLPTLTSTKLWEAQSELSHISASDSVTLWNGPKRSMSVTSGLFQVDATRKVYRTTSAEPAALQMSRKPRIVNGAMPKIESTRLWAIGQITSVEVDWISISSVGPKSPSVASVSEASSAPSSPVTDSSSVKTSTTKASSTKGFFSGLFGRKKKEPKASNAPEDSPLKAEPEIPAVPELPEEFVVKNLDETPHKKPAHTPLRQLHRHSVAYRADWDGALREAVAASHPGTMVAIRASYPEDWETALEEATKASRMSPQITRKAATPGAWSAALQKAVVASYPEIRFSRGQALPAQWTAELQGAVSESYPPQVDEFDVSVRHPVFMGSMETTAEIVHPAVGLRSSKETGSNAGQSISFDVSIRHPVFFGSMETTAKSAHPAIPAKMLKQDAVLAPLLWAKSAKTGAVTKGLWSTNGSAPKLQETSFKTEIDTARHNLRKTKDTVRSPELKADFGEQGMWRHSRRINESSQSRNRDWLDDLMKKRFSRIELRY